MVYTEADFKVEPAEPGREILVAQLAAVGYESFEETSGGVKAYIPAAAFDPVALGELGIITAEGFVVSFTTRVIAEENWNQLWESNYEPVLVAGSIYIRASFHPEKPEVAHTILIDPRMSFGTAHHETTAQMLEAMLDENLEKKTVLDMGCGTGVLAILAEQRGAAAVAAIDNDPQATDNARDNVLKNNCRSINVHDGGAEAIAGKFDVVLANINKNRLVHDMEAYVSHMKPGGVILFSGFYRDDLGELRECAEKAGLQFSRAADKNNWVMARFLKP